MTRTTQLIVLPEDEPIYSEMATIITIEDEAGGEYLKVEQVASREGIGAIIISPEDWPEIKAAIDRMIGELRENK